MDIATLEAEFAWLIFPRFAEEGALRVGQILLDLAPFEGIGAYVDAKMDISRNQPCGSKVWASEVMHGAPVIQDYLETTLRDWTEGRIRAIQRWIDEGKMRPVNPRHLLYMLWATQHYADFGHQIQTLNDGRALSERQWQEAKASVKDMVLRGIGAL
jgi:TetR/AcrR family transcriptional regulator